MSGMPHEAGSMSAGSSAPGSFTPMVDMLAGIVFILVIMLAATTLISREEFDEGVQTQAEIERIRAELAALQDIDRTVLEPRRQADAARRLLTDRLAGHLRSAGFDVLAEPEAGRFTVRTQALFAQGSARETPEGGRVAAVLATALSRELPCVGLASASTDAACANYPPARLDLAAIGYADAADDAVMAEARALSLLSAIVSDAPRLIAPRAAEDGGTSTATAIVVDLQMNVPPPPPETQTLPCAVR